MATISEALQIALEHHRAGRLDAAEEIYRRILAAEPENADALHLLGVVARQMGRHADAIEFIQRAIALNGSEAAFPNSLGNAFKDQGKLREAVDCYRRALELKPGYAEAHNNLGNALREMGDLAEAVACYRRAMELKPRYALAYNNLGVALREQGKPDEAIACCRRALELEPGVAEAHYNLGNAYKDQGKLDEAIDCYRRAVELKPGDARAHNNLGVALQEQGRLVEAIDCYRRAVELTPGDAETHNNLGNALQEQGKLDEAIDCYRRAAELKPGYAEAHNNLGNAFKDQGKLDEALNCYRRALELKPGYVEAHSNRLLALHYRAGITTAELTQGLREFDLRHSVPLGSAWRPPANVPDQQRTLRLGFVSADFGRHPVGHLYLRALEGLRAEDCRIACYSTRARSDDLTARFRAAADIWRDAAGLSDESLAQRIRDDEVDVLFELASHAAGNRLLLFARRPAPIQIAWAGPTGLSAIDYILADANLIPADAEGHYRETVLRMPDAYACFGPPAEAPAVAPLPALRRGYITFGSCNNPAKITAEVIELWSQILRRLPTSRLVVRFYSLAMDPGTRNRLSDGFAAGGIAPGRIDFAGEAPYEKRLDLYNEIDLALDPFPFTGCLTTCEALWMGVPVITRPGQTFFGRQSLSVLRSAGWGELVARDAADYVDRAVGLAEDLPRLAVLRAGLRPRMAESPLCDGRRFAANLMGLLRNVWRDWCRRPGAT